MEKYLQATPLLNYKDPAIQQLMAEQGWQEPDEATIRAIYNYVRDAIPLGFNRCDTLTASEVLADGYGQCNTKATLLMALLRAVGVPCRLRAMWVDKALQKGAVKGLFYLLTPPRILHSWAEIEFRRRWYALEGVIVDKAYLKEIRRNFRRGSMLGWAIATGDIRNPQVDWNRCDTFIQRDAVAEEIGLFHAPDDLFKNNAQNFGPVKQFAYQNIVRRIMNSNVQDVRLGALRKSM